jgi:hypothetical protein
MESATLLVRPAHRCRGLAGEARGQGGAQRRAEHASQCCVVLCVVGGLVGEAAGYVAGILIGHNTVLPIRFTTVSLLAAFPVTVALAVAATVYPAWRAASVSPALLRRE